MLKHASPYVYIGEDEKVAEEIHDDELISGWTESTPVVRDAEATADDPSPCQASSDLEEDAAAAASIPAQSRSSILGDLMSVFRGRQGGDGRARGGGVEAEAAASIATSPPAARSASPKKAKLKFAQKTKARKGTGKRQVVDTNVVAVDLGKLADGVAIHSGDVTACSGCQAILNATSTPSFSRDGDATWLCEFCGNTNQIDLDPEEQPKEASVDYILEPSKVVEGSEDQSKVVFCVDISGSMCVTTEVEGKVQFKGDRLQALRSSLSSHASGHQHLPGQRRDVTYVSRLQSMQGAVDQQLENLSKQHPKRQVGLVTFNNEVNIIGDGSRPPVVLSGDKLENHDLLVQTGRTCKAMTHSIQGSRQLLSDKLFNLEECGQTALGPAMLVAINMASSTPGSQVIVCTDGKANRGLGKLEDSSEDAAATFYNELADFAKSKGVTVSVVSIAGEECRLEHLGAVADITGGEVEKVDPMNLASNFQTLLSNPIIACDVKVTMLLHKLLCFRVDESEVAKVGKASRLRRDVGNVTADSEVFLEFSRKSEEQTQRTQRGLERADAGLTTARRAPDVIPFQVQIEFTKPCGMRCVRVITDQQMTTIDKAKCEKEVNVAICSAHATQKSSRLAQQGDYEQSRLNAFAWRNMMGRHVASESSTHRQQQEFDAFVTGYGAMDDEMLSAQRSEQADMLQLAEAPSDVRKFTRMGRRKDSGARAMFKGKKMASKAYSADPL